MKSFTIEISDEQRLILVRALMGLDRGDEEVSLLVGMLRDLPAVEDTAGVVVHALCR